MSTADHILDQIDTCLGDYDVSDDAMRWAPDPPPPVVRPHANGSVVLVRRLMDRHGLDIDQARAAVLAAERGQDTEHARLASEEARACLEEINAQFRASFQAFAERVTEQFQQVAEQFGRMKEALQRLPEAVGSDDCGKPPRLRDRPAWQSPYGPPRRR